MARFVKISTLAPALPLAPPGLDSEACVATMIELHLRPALEKVLPDRPDLIVLPEMCDCYGNFSNQQLLEYCWVRGERILQFFQEAARAHCCYLAYPTLRRLGDGSWRNSVFLIDRAGEVAGIYNKNHPMVEETTQLGILGGNRAPVWECDFGRVACAICFDLNFDALRLQYARSGPDIVLFSSVYHGGLMQAYWAYSCRAHFVASVAGVPSAMISPVGKELATTTNYFDFVTATLNLDCCVAHLDYNHEKFVALKARYGADVAIADPGFLGSVLLSSQSAGASVADMVREFNIEPLDAYLARACEHHCGPGNREP